MLRDYVRMRGVGLGLFQARGLREVIPWLSGTRDAQYQSRHEVPKIDRLGEKRLSTNLQSLALGVRIAIGS